MKSTRWEKEDVDQLLKDRPDIAARNPGLSIAGESEGRTPGFDPGKAGSSPAPATKYHSVRTVHYQSKREAQYAAELELRKKAGEVAFWLEQVSFSLPGVYTDKRGRKRQAVHRLDFLVFRRTQVTGPYFMSGLQAEFVEVKGRDLALGKLKRMQVEEIFGIKITVV